MTLRTEPPFRADHVGSLLRPEHLRVAREKWKAGELPADELKALEDEAIREVVAQQERVGLHGITDGEFRRDYWHLDFMWGFDGVKPSDEVFPTHFEGQDFEARAAQVIDKVKFPASGIMRDHFKFLATTTKETAKITIPSPAMFRHRSGKNMISQAHYPDLDQFWDDLGKAYNDAVMDFASLGCTYLQLDDVNSCVLCDERVRGGLREQGVNPDQVLETNIRINNAAVAGRPANMKITTHMCRGNFQSLYAAEGGYDAIAEKFLTGMEIDGFFMEYDDERSGGFEPLRFLPKNKFVVLGIMTSKFPELESKDELKRRIDKAAEYVALEQLCISPQCGFASTQEGNKLTHDDQWRKLARLVEVADEVWGG